MPMNLFTRDKYAHAKWQELPDDELMPLLTHNKHAERAFTAIYERYGQRILLYAVRALGEDDGHDIFQETFVRFHKAATVKGEEISNVPAFLLTITRNLCLNHKRNRKDTVTPEEFEYTAPELVHRFDAQLESDDLMQHIGIALEYLDFEFREAFVLRFYNDLSYEEIAELTGTSVSTVTNRIWRAKERLKKILAPYINDIEQF
jgi:RNA polymerase sigma-70 factor (ECF subfamily)